SSSDRRARASSRCSRSSSSFSAFSSSRSGRSASTSAASTSRSAADRRTWCARCTAREGEVRSVVLAYQDIGWIGLDELLALGADAPLVGTHEAAPGETVWSRSVAARAREAGIPVIAPPSANDPAVVSRIAALEPDFLFSFYFREILAPDVLRTARRAALN